eukprot:6193001-Pleurochrysis_carterae.AAC.1
MSSVQKAALTAHVRTEYTKQHSQTKVALLLGERLQLARHLAHVDLARAAAAGPLRVDVGERLDDALGGGRLLHVGGDEAERHQVGGHGRVVLGGQMGDVFEEAQLQLRLECRDQPPVEDAQPTISGAQQALSATPQSRATSSSAESSSRAPLTHSVVSTRFVDSSPTTSGAVTTLASGVFAIERRNDSELAASRV